MNKAIFIDDPFSLESRCVFDFDSAMTIQDVLDEHYSKKDFKFPNKTICIVDGREIDKTQWSFYWVGIHRTNTLVFVPIPEATGIITGIIVGIAAAGLAIALTPKPEVGETKAADPVYSLEGQRNQSRLGNPIEVIYGRVYHWPSYAAEPYSTFENNQQYVYFLFSIGHGEFDILEERIGDTLISNFEEVTTEVIPPGGDVTLFPEAVITSDEVEGIRLFAPNEEEYSSWSGPFVVNDAGTTISKIEIDVTLPSGLFYTGANGGLNSIQVTAEFEYQEIDDSGIAIGAWTDLVDFDKTLATQTPQRFSDSLTVPSGRYQVRGRRNNNANPATTRAKDEIHWHALKGFLDVERDYGEVTLWAVRARATNNLNDSSANDFNVKVQRKLPIYNKSTKTWSVETATSNPVWAFCDWFRSAYGGRLDDEFLDLDGLADLAAVYKARSIEFNWTQEEKTTLWDFAKVIARSGRAEPIAIGTQITMIRDQAQSLPRLIYNRENMVRDSFKRIVKFYERNEYDGLEVTYLDETSWKDKTVNVLAGYDAGNNLEKIKLPGVTSLYQAYKLGSYFRSKKVYQREQLIFRTGIEGNIPLKFDLASIDVPTNDWGESGYVVEKVGLTLTLNQPVAFDYAKVIDRHYSWYEEGFELSYFTDEFTYEFGVGIFYREFTDEFTDEFVQSIGDPRIVETERLVLVGDYEIIFRTVDGFSSKPYVVTPGASDQQVTLEVEPDETIFSLIDGEEPVIFNFGAAGSYNKLAIVEKVRHINEDEVELTCLNYDSVIYYEPEAPGDPLPLKNASPSALPRVRNITVTPLAWKDQTSFKADFAVFVGWSPPNDGADSYIVALSRNGINYDVVATTENLGVTLTLSPGKIWIRVAARRKGQGPWETWTGSFGSEFTVEFTTEFT